MDITIRRVSDPDDELDLYLTDIIELLRCFGMRERAMVEVIEWRLSELYPMVVSPSEPCALEG